MAALKTFLHGDLSALRNLETQIFCQFSFPNFSVGSVFPITIQHLCVEHKTFMHGHLCVVYESPMCSFTLPDIRRVHLVYITYDLLRKTFFKTFLGSYPQRFQIEDAT